MSLATTPFRTPVRVTSVRGSGPASLRLMEMGVFEGAELEVRGRAPLGDPLQIRVGDYDLSLRSCDAEMIEVCPA